MIAISLNKLSFIRQEWLDRGGAVLRTVGARVATLSGPLVTLSGRVFSKENWSQVAQRVGALWQEWTSDPDRKIVSVPPRDRVDLYSSQGVKVILSTQNRSLSPAANTPRFRSGWPRNAYDLDVSEAARLANGIVTHGESSPEEQNDFIQHVQTVRKLGGYDSQVFAEARQLLNQFPQSVPTYQRDG